MFLYVYTHFLCILNENAGILGIHYRNHTFLDSVSLHCIKRSIGGYFFFLQKFLHNVQTWEQEIHTTKESVHIILKTQHYPQPQKLPAHMPLAVQPI